MHPTLSGPLLTRTPNHVGSHRHEGATILRADCPARSTRTMRSQKITISHPTTMTTMNETSRFKAEAPVEIKLPRAQNWHKGMEITDDKTGEILFRVVDNINDGTDIEPKYRLFLTTDGENTEIESVVKSHRGGACFQVFTNHPNYLDQPRGIHLSGESVEQDMFLYAKLYINKKVNRVVGKGKEELEYTYKSLSGGKCCCWGSTRRVVEFHDPKNADGVVISRDQSNETLAIAVGQDLLLAVSLAYAIDRFYKFLGSKVERESRASSAQHVGSSFGLIGAAVAAAVDSKKKKVQHGDIVMTDFKQQ